MKPLCVFISFIVSTMVTVLKKILSKQHNETVPCVIHSFSGYS